MTDQQMHLIDRALLGGMGGWNFLPIEEKHQQECEELVRLGYMYRHKKEWKNLDFWRVTPAGMRAFYRERKRI